MQAEIQGAPLENLHFVVLHGNPGWLSIDEYTGTVSIGDIPRFAVLLMFYVKTLFYVTKWN